MSTIHDLFNASAKNSDGTGVSLDYHLACLIAIDGGFKPEDEGAAVYVKTWIQRNIEVSL